MPRPEITCAFTINDLAELCGIGKSAVFQQIKRGHLVLEDLMSVTKFIAAYGTDDVRFNIGYAYGRCGEYGPPVPPSKKQNAQKAMKKPPKVTQPIMRVNG